MYDWDLDYPSPPMPRVYVLLGSTAGGCCRALGGWWGGGAGCGCCAVCFVALALLFAVVVLLCSACSAVRCYCMTAGWGATEVYWMLRPGAL